MNLKAEIEKILETNIKAEIGGGHDFDTTVDKLTSLFQQLVEEIVPERMNQEVDWKGTEEEYEKFRAGENGWNNCVEVINKNLKEKLK